MINPAGRGLNIHDVSYPPPEGKFMYGGGELIAVDTCDHGVMSYLQSFKVDHVFSLPSKDHY